MGQNRTERNRGDHFSQLASPARACLPPLLSSLLLQHYCQNCPSVEGICRLPEPLSHQHTSREVHEHTSRAWRGLPLRCAKEAARPGPPLPPITLF